MAEKILDSGKLVPPIFDKMFKNLFGNPDDPEPIKYLLECVLKEKIDEVVLLPQDLIGENNKTKKNTVDVIVTLNNQRKIIVEANTCFDEGKKKRNDRFLSRLMSQELKVGDKYTLYHDHYLINFNINGSNKYPIERYTDKADHSDIEPEYYDHDIGRYTYDVNVSYFTNMCYNGDMKKLDEQAMFIGLLNCSEQDKMETFRGVNKMMDSLIDKVEEFSQDDWMAMAYNEEEHDLYMKDLHNYYFHKKLKEDEEKHLKKMDELEKETQIRIEQMTKESKEEIDKKEKESQKKIDAMKKQLVQKAKKLGLNEKDISDILNK